MTNQMITIRKPLVSECRRVFELINQLKTHLLPFEPFERIFIRNWNHQEVHYFVAEEEGHLIGFISLHISEVLHHSQPVAEIVELVIDAPYRNRSIGEMLLHTSIELARSLHCEIIEVSSNNTRERAHQFYMRNGFGRTHAKLTMPLLK
jgi:PhnO protein